MGQDVILVPSVRSRLPRLQNPWSSPKKETRSSARKCTWKYHFKTRVGNCQFLNQAVEHQLFMSLWNRFTNRLLKSSCLKLLDHSFLQLLIQALTVDSLLESNAGLVIATQLMDAGNWPPSGLYSMDSTPMVAEGTSKDPVKQGPWREVLPWTSHNDAKICPCVDPARAFFCPCMI
jgi:hypothetical protein